MDSRERVGIVGAGSWGTTLAKIAAENDHEVLLWARRAELVAQLEAQRENPQYLPGIALPAGVRATAELQRVCEGCRLLLMAVPSHGFRAVAREMAPFLDGEHLIVHTTKGIEEGTHRRMSEVLREETPVRKIGVLAGPNLAPELACGQPAGTLIASRFGDVFRRAQAALSTSYFRVFSGQDVIGAEIGGMFKNIVALAAGIVDGLGLGDNTKAFLMTRGLNEMARLGVSMGANVLTFGGMAGIGDLVATCASPHSRNHQVGVRLGRGEPLSEILGQTRMVAEGVRATRAVRAFAEQQHLRLPIVQALHGVLYEEKALADAMRDLMAAQSGDEFMGLML
ncbi:MAG: NAD(P)-dependent glycerol-3-phosphate dehydrogenase [Proteobacteria bacterium]|nr:NAD(P)-dependent glycerol-3-phosphate dehydrogenase [Pseudomonadota bacterium]